MTCEQIEGWISAYQDGELSGPRRQRVEEHLAACGACRELLAEWTALERTLKVELVRFDAPETLHTRVMRQIPESQPASLGRRGSWLFGGWFSIGLVPLGAAAAAAAVLALTTRTVPLPPAGGFHDPTHIATVQPSDPTPGTNTVAPGKPSPGQTSAANGDTTSRGGKQSGVKPGTTAQPNGNGRISPTGSKPARGNRRPRPRQRYYWASATARQRYHHAGRRTWREGLTRIVKATPSQTPVVPPPTERRVATLPRFTVVDYVLPQVPAETTSGEQTTEFVLRPAETRQLAQAEAGYEF